MNQIDIGAATQTALKEALIKSEKKRRFLLDCQLVMKTIIFNLTEKKKNTSEMQFGKGLHLTLYQNTLLKIVKHQQIDLDSW